MKKKLLAALMIPFSAIYGIIILIRNRLFDWEILPSREFNVPIISVGNLAAGGTGKTPHIEYLIRLLKNDYRVAVLSRGYRRKTHGYILARDISRAVEIGDEPCQLKRKFPDVIVAVSENRIKGIRELLKMNEGPDVILLDDAFQHRYVRPGLSILLDDFSKPAKKDFLLPSGRLREPFSSRKRADIILVTKSPLSVKAIERRLRVRETSLTDYQRLYFTRISAGKITGIYTERIYETPHNKKPSILLVSGIANPRTLKPLVRNISTRIQDLRFKDHHEYSEKDAYTILNTFLEIKQENSIILTTEKDAVKLIEYEHIFSQIKEKMFYFPIFVEFLNNEDKNFNAQILNYVKSNKRNSILHKA